jgi:hypothetical protein
MMSSVFDSFVHSSEEARQRSDGIPNKYISSPCLDLDSQVREVLWILILAAAGRST